MSKALLCNSISMHLVWRAGRKQQQQALSGPDPRTMIQLQQRAPMQLPQQLRPQLRGLLQLWVQIRLLQIQWRTMLL